MPPEVARIHDTAAGSVVDQSNIKCFILRPDGEVEAFFNAFPNNNVSSFGFDRNKAGQFFAESVRQFSSELTVPEPPAADRCPVLALPKTLPDGTPADARLLLSISPGSQLSQYLSSVAEPFLLGDECKAALGGTTQAESGTRSIKAKDLFSILSHFYPPAIMQNTGAISAVEGSLNLAPLGTNEDGAWASLTGDAILTLDDGMETRFSTKVDALVSTDQASGKFHAIRGILEGVCPKLPGRDGRGPGHQLEMTATFESLDQATD